MLIKLTEKEVEQELPSWVQFSFSRGPTALTRAEDGGPCLFPVTMREPDTDLPLIILGTTSNQTI